MLLNAGLMFGLFLLCSPYLQFVLALAAGGLYLLSRVGERGAYLHDVRPGLLIAGFSLGSAVFTSIATATGIADAFLVAPAGSLGRGLGQSIRSVE
jgi:hypothetical protein